ncbi:biogenesis of lysosome-related organelles complex 1 subunit 1, partial [Kipferlia bialata]
RRQHTEDLRSSAMSAVGTLSNTVANVVNDNVAYVFRQQRQIDESLKKLVDSTNLLHKHTVSWRELVLEFNTALKGLGDVQNAAQVMQRDLTEIGSGLKDCIKKQQETQGTK